MDPRALMSMPLVFIVIFIAMFVSSMDSNSDGWDNDTPPKVTICNGDDCEKVPCVKEDKSWVCDPNKLEEE